MTSRLLFAAARGARLEIHCHWESQDTWEEDRLVMMCDVQDAPFQYRIHPDDEALAYGPISTALREDAREGSRSDAIVYDTGYGTWGIGMIDWYAFRDCPDELHRSLFLLILSEAIADEGL